MDQAIEEALAMSLEDQKKRMTEMYKTVTTYDVNYWANRLCKLFKEIKHETVLDR
jgi:glucosylglycerol-phosphate synthase